MKDCNLNISISIGEHRVENLWYFWIAFDMFCKNTVNYINPLEQYSKMTDIQKEVRKYRDDFSKKEIVEIKNLIEKGDWNHKHFLSEARVKLCDEIVVEANKYERRKLATLRLNNKDLRKSIFDKYNNCCNYCKSINCLEIDHIVPVIKGGSDRIDNLQLLCQSCNARKGCKLESEIAWINQ